MTLKSRIIRWHNRNVELIDAWVGAILFAVGLVGFMWLLGNP